MVTTNPLKKGGFYEKEDATSPVMIFFKIAQAFFFCFRKDDKTERIIKKYSAPCRVRKQPETFCFVLIIRKSRSAWLFVNGSFAHFKKPVISFLKSRKRINKFSPLCFFRPESFSFSCRLKTEVQHPIEFF